MTRTLGLAAVIAMAVTGCKKDEDTATTSGTAGGSTSQCAQVTPFPDVNATDVYYRTTIEFQMSEIENDATITVEGVSGSQSIIDDRVVFTPDAPLAASTTYNVTLDWSCGPTTSSFTTSDIGSPADAASLVGKTYSLDLGSGRFVEPAGVGSLIGGLLEDPILLGVTSADASLLHVMGALGAGAGQDMCTESFDFPVDADFSENPYFVVQSESLDLDIQGVQVSIEDMEVSGAFSANGDQIAGATLKGTLDVSILADLVGSDPCALLVTFGVECQPCSGGGNTCLSVNVDSMQADEVGGLTLTERTTQDIACDAACGSVTATNCP